MIRFGAALVLIGMGAILCGCSSRYEAVRAEIRQQRSINNDEPLEPAVARPRRQASAVMDAAEVTGSIGRAGDIRPWPKRGTPEWNQLEAEELAREQRIKEVLSSICRGC